MYIYIYILKDDRFLESHTDSPLSFERFHDIAKKLHIIYRPDIPLGKNCCREPRWHCSFLVVFSNQAALLLNGIKDIEGAEASFPCQFGYAAMRPAVQQVHVFADVFGIVTSHFRPKNPKC